MWNVFLYGWVLGDEAPGMAIDLQTLEESLSLPASLTIERVHDEATLRTWLRIMTVGSEIPEEGLTLLLELVSRHGFTDSPLVHYYLGVLDDKPVATSLLYPGLAYSVYGILLLIWFIAVGWKLYRLGSSGLHLRGAK